MPLRTHLALALLLPLAFAPLAHAERTCPARFAKFNREELEKLVLDDADLDLFDEQMLTASPEEATFWNETLIETVDGLPIATRNAKRLNGLDPEAMKKLLGTVNRHPVADSRFYNKYSPEGNIGFCFGRAITAHIEALRLGVAKENIKKVWIVGQMTDPSTNWGHHVATIVRGTDGRWYTIDPNYSKPLTLTEWHQKLVTGYKNDGRLQLFVTNPLRFGPEGGVDAGPMLPTTVEDPFYNKFFEDLMRQSRQEAKQLLEQKRMERGYCSITSSPALLSNAKYGDEPAPKKGIGSFIKNCFSAFLKKLPGN